jgi:transcriptional regulator with XRE-family HTH domain
MAISKTYRSDVPDLLLRCRSERNLSLKEVGKAVGLSDRQVANIELGISKPRRTTRMRIEAFLRKHGYFPKPEAT